MKRVTFGPVKERVNAILKESLHLFEGIDLLLPDAEELGREGGLPRVQLQHLDPIQYLIHKLHTLVVV
jgi:hypothetical protein